ncbi:MAG: hypothetical protein ACIAXF_05715 [Phycisphaerales bacterium JB063]
MDSDRIGQIMIELGILTPDQVDQVLASQTEYYVPFGKLTETMFGIDEFTINQAVADQIAGRTPYTKLCEESFDPDVLSLFTAREAWDTLLLPIRMEDGELRCATTVETLSSAIELMQDKPGLNYQFVLAEMRPIEEFIANLYAYEGVDVADESEAA